MNRSSLLTLAGLLQATLLPAQWTLLNTFTPSNLADVAFCCPDSGVVVGDRGTVYRTTDAGGTWHLITPDGDMAFTSVAVRSGHDFLVSGYKGVSGGNVTTRVFATHNAGQTWETVFQYDDVGEPSQVRYSGSDLYFLAPWKGLLKSTDGGSTWETMFRAGSTTILTSLKTDRSRPGSIFAFGNVGGFATYSCQFMHTTGNDVWDGCSAFEFGNSSAFTAFDVINDTVILFRNFYKLFQPDDTSNILALAYDFVRDDLIPGGATGDTVWHFSIETVTRDIPHLVNGCHFFSLTGAGYSIEEVGGINLTEDGGAHWARVYEGQTTLKSICMLSDTMGYAVGNGGTVVRLGTGTSSAPWIPSASPDIKVYPTPASDWLVIERTPGIRPAKIIIRNLSGQEMLTRDMTGNRMQIDLSGWPGGVYILTGYQDGEKVVKKFVK
jgi:photosystem II stability/assembly factor-like uncharacterized protein